MSWLRRGWILLICLAMAAAVVYAEDAEDLEIGEVVEDVLLDEKGEEIPLPSGTETPLPAEETPIPAEETHTSPAREDFIRRIIATGKKLYEDAGGKRKRAHYKGDDYVCKNYTVRLFKDNRKDFRMAEFPETTLVIPNNLPADKCKPYKYGFLWEEVPAEKGNPFVVGAQFIYDSGLSKEENLERAKEFMRQAQPGDFFQMSAQYEYGIGAHSAILMGYDPETDEIHWLYSNMRGGKIKGIRYGVVQYDEVKSVEWWAKAFCHKGRGATMYRLREDIVYAEGAGPKE